MSTLLWKTLIFPSDLYGLNGVCTVHRTRIKPYFSTGLDSFVRFVRCFPDTPIYKWVYVKKRSVCMSRLEEIINPEMDDIKQFKDDHHEEGRDWLVDTLFGK